MTLIVTYGILVLVDRGGMMTITNEDSIKEVADAVSHAVNVMGNGEIALATALLNDHRTLIQRKAVVFLSFFRQLAEDADHGWTDERDAAAGKLAQAIRDIAGDFGEDLPFI